MNRKLIVEASLVAALVATVSVACAQAPAPAAPALPPAKRTILQTADVAASPAQEILFGTVEIAPGSGNARHRHAGTEHGYVLEGQLRQEVEGEAPRVLGPGDTFMIARGKAHQSFLLGGKPVKIISTWTVDKGAPLMTPAP